MFLYFESIFFNCLQMLGGRDKILRREEENEELKEKIEDLEHDLSQSRLKADKFERCDKNLWVWLLNKRQVLEQLIYFRLLADALQHGGRPSSRVVDPSVPSFLKTAGSSTPTSIIVCTLSYKYFNFLNNLTAIYFVCCPRNNRMETTILLEKIT